MAGKYVLGLDYGTESARALLVAVETGEEVATAVAPYRHGVIDKTLPGNRTHLPPEWALQDPEDYLAALDTIVPDVLRAGGVAPEAVIGIGVDFTACTMLPIDAQGTPLCAHDAWRTNPHAWVKLWQRHAAAPQAERITRVALERDETFLARYGGIISSEWFLPKLLHTLEEAPDVYDAADRFIEAADWVVLQLTGEEKRNACCAGYKGLYGDDGYPSPDYLEALDPRLTHLVGTKVHPDVHPVGVRAGGLQPAMAQRLGLPAGTAVSTAIIDAHAGVPACATTGPGEMVIIMGTSFCHMVCDAAEQHIPGVAGVVRDGILPGLYGYEAGQAAGGDLYAWFVERCVPASTHEAARAAGTNVHRYLSAEAARLPVGASGLVFLDWWNGNRSVLVNPELSGLMCGMTLATTPAEQYRAALESTAYGTYKIIQEMERGGVRIEGLKACGGLPNHNPLCMQIFADVTGRPIEVAASEQTVALGAAMWGAVAAGASAGGYDDVRDAAAKMARLKPEAFTPDAERHAAYQPLYDIYLRLHDHFGRGGDACMRELKEIRRAALRTG